MTWPRTKRDAKPSDPWFARPHGERRIVKDEFWGTMWDRTSLARSQTAVNHSVVRVGKEGRPWRGHPNLPIAGPLRIPISCLT